MLKIEKKSVERLAAELAKGWTNQLNLNQRRVLAVEVLDLVEACVARALAK